MGKKLYLHNKRTNERYILNGDVATDEKPTEESLSGDFTERMVIDEAQLPPKVDLRPWMTDVENQFKLKSCTANAIAGAYEYLHNKATGQKINVSRLFVYYNARLAGLPPGGKLSDTGSSINHALSTMSNIGGCLEDMWDYIPERVNDKPDPECYNAAQDHMIIEALEVDLDLNEMKTCLAQGFPIIVSINVYSSFDQAQSNGIVPLPQPNEGIRATHGRHAVLVVGYSNSSRAFIVRNSWGKSWGKEGYCFIPYEYLTNHKFTNYAWTVKKLNVPSFDEVGWCPYDSVNYTDQQGNEQYGDAASNEGASPEDEEDAEIEEVDEDED